MQIVEQSVSVNGIYIRFADGSTIDMTRQQIRALGATIPQAAVAFLALVNAQADADQHWTLDFDAGGVRAFGFGRGAP